MRIPLVGFAGADRWENPPLNLPNNFKNWIPTEFWPRSIYPETETVIVIGLPVQLPIVETAPSIFYHELYKTVNSLLDLKAYELSEILNQKGFASIYIPRDGYGDIDILLKNPLTFFSHRHAAYLSGLGSFGQNNVILTPEYGPRVRFTSIFTSAVIESDPIHGDDLCTRCLRCIDECPVNAIPPLPSSDKNVFPEIIDKISCAKRSKSLREKYTSPCGICIKVCPIGKDRKLFSRENMDIYNSSERFKKYKNAWNHVKSYGGHE
ncbi:4Fe-4S double cluster binding domain-containing protein [Methanobacterium alcaliphilum]|uniref:4Fe-4S double cluster binding domain-containing protein n=1 Tax=Methanobacterium alcaliphilum TaxID=392018 RepID=UPI00200A5A8B|nr:4Fe-4S double cluster binding domain-containing protein [Methanobacterium alcaliphilum]MCK9151280.1 4Fe-4S binding protein [Methanobacterium alcaliphilum]